MRILLCTPFYFIVFMIIEVSFTQPIAKQKEFYASYLSKNAKVITSNIETINKEDTNLTFGNGNQNPFTGRRNIAGIMILLSYSTTVAVSGLYFKSSYTSLYIPVIGPFLALSNSNYILGEYRGLVWFSGFAQASFFSMFVIYAIQKSQWDNDNNKIQVSLNMNNPMIKITMRF